MKQELFKGVGWEQVSREDYRPQEAIRPLYNDVQNLDPVTQMLYIDTRANLPDDLLMVGGQNLHGEFAGNPRALHRLPVDRIY